MAASNTYDTSNLGSAVGNTEDLTRGAYLISPENTPLYSSLNKVRAKATYHEWLVDDMDDPNTDGTVEGADVDAFEDAFKDQARVGNYIHTKRRTAKVTNIQDLVDNADKVNFAGAVTKKLMELNLDCEAVIEGTQARSAGSKTSARVAAGFGEQLGGSSTVFPAEYECPTASVVASGSPTEDTVDAVIRSIFVESGNRPRLRLYGDAEWLHAFNYATARLVSTGTDGAATRVNVAAGTPMSLNFRVRIYESQHGAIEVFDLNPKCSSDPTNLDTAFFINPEYACITELGGLVNQELPDNGGGRRVKLERHFCPVIKNPRAHGYWKAI